LEESYRFVYCNENGFTNELTILGNRFDLCQPPSYDVVIDELSDGMIHIRPDPNKEAYQVFETAKTASHKDRTNVQARLQLGFSMIQLGYLPEGLKEVEEAFDLESSFKTLMAFGIAFEQCGMPEESASAFKKCLELEPENTMAMIKLASSYLKMDLTKEANALLEAVIEKEPSNGAAHLFFALSLSKQRNLERAATECQTVIDLKFELSAAAENLLQLIGMMQQLLSKKLN
jgi:Tfp pilus assembly protein PilF